MTDLRGRLAAPSTHLKIRFLLAKQKVRAVIPNPHGGEGTLFDRPGGAAAAFVLLAIAVLSVIGCEKKSFSKTELRAVTDEVVSAAQRVTGRKSEITIRPEIQSSRTGVPGQLAADNIYISLEDPSKADALRQALAEIAHRHKLDVAESSSGGVLRYDFSFATAIGRTRFTLSRRSPPARDRRPRAPAGNPRLAIILDDMGHDRAAADSLLALPFPLTISVLPHLPLSAEVAEEAYRRGDQILLHLPMEPEAEGERSEGVTPEEIELRVGMNRGSGEFHARRHARNRSARSRA